MAIDQVRFSLQNLTRVVQSSGRQLRRPLVAGLQTIRESSYVAPHLREA